MSLRSLLERCSSERGSVLALVPAGFLVLVLLSALAVDSAAVYQGQRQLHDVLAAAADDAASAGLDSGAFYRGGSIVLSTSAVAAQVCRSVAGGAATDLHDVRVSVVVDGDAVRVEGTAVVYAIFGKAVPGFGARTVSAAADSVLSAGPLAVAPVVSGAPVSAGC